MIKQVAEASRSFWGPMPSLSDGLGVSLLIAADSSSILAPPNLSVGTILTWLVVGGGSAWAIKQIGELCRYVVFSVKSGWHAADKETDHGRWQDCERHRAADQAEIKSLREQLQVVNDRIHDKDIQYDSLFARDREKDVLIIDLNRRFMEISQTVSNNSRMLAEHVVSQKSPESPLPVRIEPGPDPLPVREVGGPHA